MLNKLFIRDIENDSMRNTVGSRHNAHNKCFGCFCDVLLLSSQGSLPITSLYLMAAACFFFDTCECVSFVKMQTRAQRYREVNV